MRVGPFAFRYQGNGANPCQYIDTTRKAIDCATTLPLYFYDSAPPRRQSANRGSTVVTQPNVHGPIQTKKRNKKMDQPQREIYCLAGVELSASCDSCREPVYPLHPRKFQRYFLPGLSLSSYSSTSVLTEWLYSIYNETLQQTFRPLLSKLSKTRQI